MPALPPSAHRETGPGGLARVRVTGRSGEAEIYLHGAHVTAWNPVGQAPVLWMSRASQFRPDAPLRGGVPLCFPWFGAHPTNPHAPAHGFARLVEWSLLEAGEVGDDVMLMFHLADSRQTRSGAWPHRFEASYTVTVGARLTLELQVTNVDAETVTYEEALHTYLAVSDIRDVGITGLEGAVYVDRLAGPEPRRDSTPIRFTGETDRIYADTGATTTFDDHAGRRAMTLRKAGSRTTVVWNPWRDKAAAMSDFGDDEWTHMVCVEASNVRDAAVRLEPGARHTMTATLEVSPPAGR